MKKDKIIYWISTGLLALFILSGAFFINSEMAIEGTRHLGLPEWFRWEVSIGSLIGGLILLAPVLFVRLRNSTCFNRLKEWNYAALGIVYVSALIAHLSIDGLQPLSFMPMVTFAILVVSYCYYHKIQAHGMMSSIKQ